MLETVLDVDCGLVVLLERGGEGRRGEGRGGGAVEMFFPTTLGQPHNSGGCVLLEKYPDWSIVLWPVRSEHRYHCLLTVGGDVPVHTWH